MENNALRYHEGFYPYSAKIDFRRQILMSKVDPRTVRIAIFEMTVEAGKAYYKDISMISNCKKTL